jgi:translation elongation factor EF-Ts
MKPKSIGQVTKQALEENPKGISFDDNETRLLYQEFLFKPNTRVIDFLNENKVEVVDFVRVECGEVAEEQKI